MYSQNCILTNVSTSAYFSRIFRRIIYAYRCVFNSFSEFCFFSRVLLVTNSRGHHGLWKNVYNNKKERIFSPRKKNALFYKPLNFKAFQDFFFCILATTSMCDVLDRKNLLDRAEVYGKNTLFYALFCANVYWWINMQRAENQPFVLCFFRW